ncbi:MarR family winged helix-turn-helix transcriptional regulator [Aquabacterium sp. OR-4]|uniref:MarR family winged helix-turn-helix transcriptional regulator n=1 Tax=Aquabacterium sp. OR-4 TaxID=2978127 RepID=UPI0021B25CA3|nr:MarR family transcriptional regulator [Aquabacterium sp. OR-4]MDT7835765.1 MarR family transcriptional regulator [Aquabacterium sp. OR-4]
MATRTAGQALSLGALEEVLGFHLATATVTTMDTFYRHVGEPLNLRKVEYSLLLLLLANGPLPPKRLGQALALSAPNLTLLLDRLQQRELIRRERSEADRRSHNVVLTPEGQRVAEAGATAAVPMERELDSRLTRAERLMLIELLRKVAAR